MWCVCRQLDRQLRLYDVRLPQTELFSFGWKQESSESQSALINQSWSPDGLHISSGSADPVIHIFDIRYNAPSPSLSIKAHKKRVFKAEWHSSLQLLVSISSDLEIGIHKLWWQLIESLHHQSHLNLATCHKGVITFCGFCNITGWSLMPLGLFYHARDYIINLI